MSYEEINLAPVSSEMDWLFTTNLPDNILDDEDIDTSAETNDSGGDISEEDLTNLNWLTENKNITNIQDIVTDVLDDKKTTHNGPAEQYNKFIGLLKNNIEEYIKRKQVYSSDSTHKPPFNYSQIIGMALMEGGRLTLRDICDWIQNKFAYYNAKPNWNSSIRHNLSLNPFFTKVEKNKNEKGKGGYWKLAVNPAKSKKKRIRNRRKCIKKTNASLNATECENKDESMNEKAVVISQASTIRNGTSTSGNIETQTITTFDVCAAELCSFESTVYGQVVGQNEFQSGQILLASQIPSPIDELTIPFQQTSLSVQQKDPKSGTYDTDGIISTDVEIDPDFNPMFYETLDPSWNQYTEGWF